jgi:pimeloyl-ACP methyl ester carboxylesterase
MGSGRRHGAGPVEAVVVHGGPGGCGELGPVARRLAVRRAVLEPWSTALSVEAEIAELEDALAAAAVVRAVVIGHSWGAWLALLHAERHPGRVAAVVMVGAPPFDAEAAATIAPTRLSRLTAAERAEVEALAAEGFAASDPDAARRFARLGAIFARADAFDPLPVAEAYDCEIRADVFAAVWPEAAELRASGELKRRLGRLPVPLIAIHGDHDPHPASAIAALADVVPTAFRFHLLTGCGHAPWRERHAAERFFALVESEVDRCLVDRGEGAHAAHRDPTGSATLGT